MINLGEVKEIFLSGGNIYGVSYVGALKALNIYINLNKQITRWLGTSAGGIIAFLIAIGYTPNLLEDLRVAVLESTGFNMTFVEKPLTEEQADKLANVLRKTIPDACILIISYGMRINKF